MGSGRKGLRGEEDSFLDRVIVRTFEDLFDPMGIAQREIIRRRHAAIDQDEESASQDKEPAASAEAEGGEESA